MTDKTNAPIDLSGFDAAIQAQEEGILVPIKGMDGKTDLGLSIRVAGPDSDRARQAQQELSDELIAEEKLNLSAGEIVERSIRYVAKITLGWEPAIKMDGKEMAYSEANAVKLYTKYNFIYEQVNKAAGNRANFTKG